MPKLSGGYRLVLEGDNSQSASDPESLERILVAFDERVAAGVFHPDSGQRLLVLSDEEWLWRRRDMSS